MNVTIIPTQLKGTVKAIPSKSVAHRALICAALSDQKTQIENLIESEDILATQDCLKALNACEQANSKNEFYKKNTAVLNCRESGSTLRFTLPVALAKGGNFAFQMQGRLPQRPLSPLYEQLTAHGCNLSAKGTNPLTATGKLTPGDFTLPGNISSQFISGLLLALPLLEADSKIHITGNLESEPYIDITRHVQQIFGVHTRFENQCFYIHGNQTYRSPGHFTVEGDWSNAAFWFCADSISLTPVTCTGVSLDSVQGDKAVLTLLKNLPCDIDAHNIPDLVPAISAAAALTPGKTVIYNAKRLIIKESNRIETVCKVLSALGAAIEATPDGLIIYGKEHLDGGTVHAFQDHRIAMMAAIAAIGCKNAVTITNAEAVQKSYPTFWEDYQKLGGQIKEEL